MVTAPFRPWSFPAKDGRAAAAAIHRGGHGFGVVAGTGCGSVLARIPWRRRWCDDLYVPTSVLIVDDHAGFRARARKMLCSAGYHVVGEAADGADGMGEARRL